MMQAIPVIPPRARLPDEVYRDFIEQVRATEVFEQKDLEWIESILSRQDQADGYLQLTNPFVFARQDHGENLYAMCKIYNAKKAELTPVERHEAKIALARLLWSKRVSSHRMQKIILASPQRKQHPRYPTPNLHNWEGAGQHVGLALLATYGLDYVAARTQCVKQALSDADATHIMFVDDDVMLPRRAAQTLFDTGLPSVAGIYVKKSEAAWTNTTTNAEHPTLVYSQQPVEPKVGDMTPRPASCVGGGMWLLNLDLFRKLPEPWFHMVQNPDGGVVIGEDSCLLQKLAGYGVETHVIPGLIGIHVDFATGNHFGPPELVDPMTHRLRKEHEHAYHPFPADLDLKELLAADVVDYFKKNVGLREQGLIK